MRIKEITYQHRRDFQAIYECDHCGQKRVVVTTISFSTPKLFQVWCALNVAKKPKIHTDH